MEELDMPKIVYAMYLALHKNSRYEPSDNKISALEQKFMRSLNKEQLETYQTIQKLYQQQQEFNEKDVVKFVLYFIKNLF